MLKGQFHLSKPVEKNKFSKKGGNVKVKKRFRNGFGIASVALLVLGFAVLLFPANLVLAQEEVVLLIQFGPEADALKPVVEEFNQKEPGVKVTIQEMGRQTYNPLKERILLSKSPEADLLYGEGYGISAYAESGTIEPIDQFLSDPELTPADFDLEDMVLTLKYKGKAYALAFDGGSFLLLLYRSDLIPEPPQTWQEVTSLARQFTKSHNPDSPTIYGIGWYGSVAKSGPRIHAPMVWEYGGRLIDDAGNVAFDSPEALKGPEILAGWLEEGLMSPEVASWGYTEVKESIETGIVAMAPAEWNAAYVNRTGPLKDKIKAALTPGVGTSLGVNRVTYSCLGLTLMMNKASKHKKAAWKFLLYLLSDEAQRIYARNGGTPARFSLLHDLGFARELNLPEYYPLVAKSWQLLGPHPMTPYWTELFEVSNTALSEIWAKKATPKEAFSKAAEKLRGIMAE